MTDVIDMSDDLALIGAAAAEAASIAMRYFRKSPDTWYKGEERSPVSEADIAVDRFLREHLLAARPNYGWLSEETEDDAGRLGQDRLFVVDPIDGTRAFIAGEPDWCVSIAVISEGRAVAGVLAAPARGETWLAAAGAGALRNGALLSARAPRTPDVQLLVSMPDRIAVKAVAVGGGQLVRAPGGPSLALRLARVAAGELGAVFVRPRAKEWDIAAADVMLSETGHVIVDATGQAVGYNRPDPSHGLLIAAAPAELPFLRGVFPGEAGH